MTQRPHSVRLQDRVVDVLAALFLGVGVLLFAVGRQALGAIADGTYPAPKGVSWVAVADVHNAQTTWGLWLAGAGIALSVISAARHLRHRRLASSRQSC